MDQDGIPRAPIRSTLIAAAILSAIATPVIVVQFDTPPLLTAGLAFLVVLLAIIGVDEDRHHRRRSRH